jgi:Protein of unknown function (DUF3072)
VAKSSTYSGITNRQARYLAALQRKAGEPYIGNGLTSWQASLEITRLRKLLGREGPTRKP